MAASKSHAPKRWRMPLTLGRAAAKAGREPSVTCMRPTEGVEAVLALDILGVSKPDLLEPRVKPHVSY